MECIVGVVTTYTDLELWAIVSAVYYDKNEFMTIQTGRTAGGLRQQVAGLQAELLHTESIDPVEQVARPAEVFVTPRDVFELTTYGDMGTVRHRLNSLVEEGLLELHGDIVSHAEGERRLYIPAEMGHEELVSRLHKLSGRPLPPKVAGNGLEHVVPTDFTHKEEGVFVFDEDDDVEIDVADPGDGRSIRRYVEQQLVDAGLTADVDNFYYKLRKWAGLVD